MKRIKIQIRNIECERQCRVDYYEKNRIARRKYREELQENRKELRECLEDCKKKIADVKKK